MDLTDIFKALGDENRIKIIKMLQQEELCVCEIIEAFKHLTQPTISHHLKNLKHAGLVNDRKEGKWVYYSLNKEALGQIKSFLEEILSPSAGTDTYKKHIKCEGC